MVLGSVCGQWKAVFVLVGVCLDISRLFFCLFDSLRPSQHFVSHVAGHLPGLNRYLAEDKMFCTRTQRSASGEARTRNLKCLYGDINLTYLMQTVFTFTDIDYNWSG